MFVILARQHPLYSAGAFLYIFYFLFLRFVVLTFYPTQFIKWNDNLDRLGLEGFPLPAFLAAIVGPVKVPVRYLLLIGFFRGNARVLDAWVVQHSGAALTYLCKLSTVKARQTYVPLPVYLDDGDTTNLASLTPQSLHPTCTRERWCIRIVGEGGSGKTTLACQIARWALVNSPEDRLCPDRRAIPVLIEPGMVLEFDQSISFRNLIRTQLKAETSEAVSEPVLDHLLQTRRIVVILDGASEMAGASVSLSTRFRIDCDFPACALIVTSRTTDLFVQGVYTDILPSRIDTEHLSPFMNAYLRKANLELEDASLFEACRRLAVMVGKRRGITPLLAELYAKALVRLYKDNNQLKNLPGSIPELMVQYLDDLNGRVNSGRIDTYKLQAAAKRAAWECVRLTFRPGRGNKQTLIDDPTVDHVEKDILVYLEKEMQLIEPLPDLRFQFALDPLAEYLAALYIVNRNRSDIERWQEFLKSADAMPGAPVETVDFLTAVADCIRWEADSNVPPSFVTFIDDRVAEARIQMANAQTQNHEVIAPPALNSEKSVSGDGSKALAASVGAEFH